MIALSYVISFLLVRLLVILAGSAENEIINTALGGKPRKFYIGRNIILFGYHIHHFYFGILLMGMAGWISIVGTPKISKEKLALIFGTGLGLLMDEIGLLLTWGNYASSLSYLLGAFLLGVFLNVIYFPQFWAKVEKDSD